MKPKETSKFGFDDINRLNKLFVEKGWDKFEEFDTFFLNYCSMLEHLNPDQTTLVIDLTKRFIWLRFADYFTHLKNTLLKLQIYSHLDLSTIHIIPMMSRLDRQRNKNKSSNLLAYLCQDSGFRHNEVLKNTQFKIHTNLEALPLQRTLKKGNNPILLLDDFIGTGDTALDSLEHVLEHRSYDNQTLYIVSLICQENAKTLINSKGFEVVSENFMGKGISDAYEISKVEDARNLMVEIEMILQEDSKFDSQFKFGYKSSEALAALIRTPNNTFPIYWFSAQSGIGQKWKAPFQRV